jgi:hypothetical protein
MIQSLEIGLKISWWRFGWIPPESHRTIDGSRYDCGAIWTVGDIKDGAFMANQGNKSFLWIVAL